MASIFGHALTAVSLARTTARDPSDRPFSRSVTVAAVIVGIAPDLDVLTWILFRPEGMTPHRGFTHSILFAFTTATIAWLILSRGSRPGGPRLAGAMYLAALSHPLLDYLMGSGAAIPLFWPFTSHGYLSPVQLVPSAYYSSHILGLIHILTTFRLIKGLLLELLIILPILMAQKKARPGARLRWWIPALTVSALTELAVYFIYN